MQATREDKQALSSINVKYDPYRWQLTTITARCLDASTLSLLHELCRRTVLSLPPHLSLRLLALIPPFPNFTKIVNTHLCLCLLHDFPNESIYIRLVETHVYVVQGIDHPFMSTVWSFSTSTQPPLRFHQQRLYIASRHSRTCSP